jgi:hypothetical protein
VNPRIRELAEQAGINIDSFQFSGTPIKHIVGESSLENFAELIVRECCDWIDGSPANDAGQLHLTKSFIIANLKGMFRSKE